MKLSPRIPEEYDRASLKSLKRGDWFQHSIKVSFKFKTEPLMNCCGFNDLKWFMEFIGKPSGIIGSWRGMSAAHWLGFFIIRGSFFSNFKHKRERAAIECRLRNVSKMRLRNSRTIWIEIKISMKESNFSKLETVKCVVPRGVFTFHLDFAKFFLSCSDTVAWIFFSLCTPVIQQWSRAALKQGTTVRKWVSFCLDAVS